MKYIEHIIEPKRLLLSWQSSSPEHRGRMFVAELISRGDDADLVYLSDSEGFKKATTLGFENYPGFSLEKQRHEKVLSAFMKRLPPRSRGDFEKYLTSLRIKKDSDISDMALLGYSGAKLPDDNFLIINPFENAVPPFEFMLPVAGYRYRKDRLPLEKIKLGCTAIMEPEPDNEFDPKAIKVLIHGEQAGYVCRGLTESFHRWFALGYLITATVEKLNGTEEKPDVYLYVEVRQP